MGPSGDDGGQCRGVHSLPRQEDDTTEHGTEKTGTWCGVLQWSREEAVGKPAPAYEAP